VRPLCVEMEHTASASIEAELVPVMAALRNGSNPKHPPGTLRFVGAQFTRSSDLGPPTEPDTASMSQRNLAM
jgi:hypothetical protein